MSEAFAKRFRDEIDRLGGKGIKVELVASGGSYGRAQHAITLRGSERTGVKSADVLSEGEFRVVSLAAFLADVVADVNGGGLVFDDPICSLDEQYEENIVRRLVEISIGRQVIVFTHRLSTYCMLYDIAKEMGVPVREVCLRCEEWGAGEPGEMGAWRQSPKSALNSLRAQLPNLRRTEQDAGGVEFENKVRAFCGRLRIVLERIVETHICASMVERYRQSIQTLNRIHRVACVEQSDCDIVDEMMTKYSYGLHSQPHERPTRVPSVAQLECDIERIIEWRGEFAAKVRAAKKSRSN